MIPLSCSIAGEGRVKWLSYGKSKGESIRCCPAGDPHGAGRQGSTGLGSGRPFYIPIAEA